MLCAFAAFAQPQPGAYNMEAYLPMLKGKNVAVCGNQTSKVGSTHLVDTLLERGVHIVRLFCPEHGFRGEAEAGAAIASSVDKKTGLPVVSLYGKNKKPQPEQLKGIDVLLFDLQDVGCRFYTYISTLHYVMEAAAENDVPVVVLDRPNPNGYFIDGPVLVPQFRSFVGMHPVPVVYGMTIGEYAQMINGEKWLRDSLQCSLTVVKNRNYDHSDRYALPVSPSPNLPCAEAVYLYPSLCFFEGTDVSVGRGTSFPFQIYGSPQFVEGDYEFAPHPIKGVSENPLHKGEVCRGFYLRDTATANLNRGNSLNLQYMLTAYRQYNDERFFTNAAFFDKLAGSDMLRKQILSGMTEAEIRASWQADLAKFKEVRSRYLLYD